MLPMEAREYPNTPVQAERLMAMSGPIIHLILLESLLAGHPTFSGLSDSFGGNMVSTSTARPQQCVHHGR